MPEDELELLEVDPNPTPQLDERVEKAGLLTTRRRQVMATIGAVVILGGLLWATSQGGESTAPDIGPSPTQPDRNGTDTLPPLIVPTPEADPTLIDVPFRDAFFANIKDHPPRARCILRLNTDTATQALGATAGQPNQMMTFSTESPFSHWLSLATTDSLGNFQNLTTQKSRLDFALDADIAGSYPTGTDLVCRQDNDGLFNYEPSNSVIYPHGTPTPQTVANIIGSTFELESSSFVDGRDVYSYTTAIHIGNGQLQAPWFSNTITHLTPDGLVTSTSRNTIMHNFDRPDFQLANVRVDELEPKDDIYITDLQLPEVTIGDLSNVQPGESLIISGFERVDGAESGERFFYRIVALGFTDDGSLLAGAGVEDSGSFNRTTYKPLNDNRLGAHGAGVYTIDGALVGTLSDAHTYDRDWDDPYYGNDTGSDEPAFNRIIDNYHERLGLPTPRHIVLAERQARDQLRAAHPGTYRPVEISPPAFDSIVTIKSIAAAQGVPEPDR